jgi:hypothetical protein
MINVINGSLLRQKAFHEASQSSLHSHCDKKKALKPLLAVLGIDMHNRKEYVYLQAILLIQLTANPERIIYG